MYRVKGYCRFTRRWRTNRIMPNAVWMIESGLPAYEAGEISWKQAWNGISIATQFCIAASMENV